jgi:hypothetical protein
MLYDKSRTRSGNMPNELQARVDRLLEEFMSAVDAVSEDRHLQKGIARSQLPSSMVAILDKENLNILAQFRPENRFSTYIHNPGIAISPQKASMSAQWEFGFEDPFIIQIPAELLDKGPEERRPVLEKIATEHIDSEFKRFMGLLSLLRTRPIFGPAPMTLDSHSAFVLLPASERLNKNYPAIEKAAVENGVILRLARDIREGRAAVKDLWESINGSRVIIADLTGPDPGVMYALGIAHTVGRDTVLICPKGSKYLVDIPRTRRIEYRKSEVGREKLGKDLSEMLKSMLEPVAET